MADAGSIESKDPSDIESIISFSVSSKPRGKGQLNKSFLRKNLKKAIAKTINNDELLQTINRETDTKEKAEAFIRRTISDTPAPSKILFEQLKDEEDVGEFKNPNDRKTLLTILRRAELGLQREDIANIEDKGKLGEGLRQFVQNEFTRIPSREERQEATKKAGGATQAEETKGEEEPTRPRKRQTKRPKSPPGTPEPAEETKGEPPGTPDDQPTTGQGKETTVRKGDKVDAAEGDEDFTTGAEGDGLDDERNRRVKVDKVEMPLTKQETPQTDNPIGQETVSEDRLGPEGRGTRPRQEEAVGDGIEQTEGQAVAMAGAGAGTGEVDLQVPVGAEDAIAEAMEADPALVGQLQELAESTPAPPQQQPMEEGETFESVSPQPSAIDLITASGLLSKPKYHGRLIQNARELVGQHDHLKGLKADDLSKLDNKELHELTVLNVKLYGRKIGVKKVFTKPTSKRADLEQEYHEVSMLIHFWYSTKLGVGTSQPRIGMMLPQSAIGGLAPLLDQLGQLTQGGMSGMGRNQRFPASATLQPQEHPAHTQHLTAKQQLQRNLAQATGQQAVESTPTQPREIPREMDRPRNRPFDLSSRYGVKDRVRRNIMNRAGMGEGLALNFG